MACRYCGGETECHWWGDDYCLVCGRWQETFLNIMADQIIRGMEKDSAFMREVAIEYAKDTQEYYLYLLKDEGEIDA